MVLYIVRYNHVVIRSIIVFTELFRLYSKPICYIKLLIYLCTYLNPKVCTPKSDIHFRPCIRLRLHYWCDAQTMLDQAEDFDCFPTGGPLSTPIVRRRRKFDRVMAKRFGISTSRDSFGEVSRLEVGNNSIGKLEVMAAFNLFNAFRGFPLDADSRHNAQCSYCVYVAPVCLRRLVPPKFDAKLENTYIINCNVTGHGQLNKIYLGKAVDFLIINNRSLGAV